MSLTDAYWRWKIRRQTRVPCSSTYPCRCPREDCRVSSGGGCKAAQVSEERYRWACVARDLIP